MGLQKVIAKLHSIRMAIDPTKLEIQHFSCRPKDSSFPALRTTDPITSEDICITPTKVTRWLGFYLDKRLSFNKHVDIMCKRASSVLNGICCLGNTIWGLSQQHLHLLYITCVFPILTYGVTVWYWEHKSVKTLLRKMEVIQNKAIRLVTGAFRTTPIAFLPPIEIWARKLIQQAAIRLHKLPTLCPVIQHLPDIWRDGKKPEVTTPFSTPTRFGYKTQKMTELQSLASRVLVTAEKIFPFHSDNSQDIIELF